MGIIIIAPAGRGSDRMKRDNLCKEPSACVHWVVNSCSLSLLSAVQALGFFFFFHNVVNSKEVRHDFR